MNFLVCRVKRSSSTVKKAAVFLSAVMVLLAPSLPLFLPELLSARPGRRF